MDKDHIHLLLDEPIYVLHEHFESMPLETVEEPDTEEYLVQKGNNNKGILIINLDDNVDLISQEDEEFLFKGLNALDITLEDVLITGTNATDHLQDLNKVIRFTLNPDPANLYKVEEIDGMHYLECDSIQTIRPNIELQKKFWIALKTLFNRM